jgi:biotin carboxyl carrier protein
MPDHETPLRVKANEFEFSFTRESVISADIIKHSAFEYHLLKDHRSVMASVLESDEMSKQFIVEVEGESFLVTIRDELDQVVEKMGFNESANRQIREVRAPMPGLVLDISVSNGQGVQQGDRILVLEAMKMENSILAHAPATIKKVLVNKGQAVEKGQVLVELE